MDDATGLPGHRHAVVTTGTPRASILIPTHDNDWTLPYTVRSVLNQTVPDIEVLLCGDGVTDRARVVVESLVALDDRVVFLDLPKGPNRGEIRRHEAILSARSDAIVYLCDDDLLMPDHVADLLELLADHDLVQSLNGRVDPEGAVSLYPGSLGDPETVAWIIREDRRFNSVSITGTAHSRSRYLDLGVFWETTPEETWPDHHQWRRMLRTGKVRAATSRRMTALQFPSGEHGRSGWDRDQRADEVARWSEFISRPGAQAWIDRMVLDGAVLQLAALHRDTVDLEAALRTARVDAHRLTAACEGLQHERDLLELESTRATQELSAVRRTVSWRVTAPLRSVRRAIRRPARPVDG